MPGGCFLRRCSFTSDLGSNDSNDLAWKTDPVGDTVSKHMTAWLMEDQLILGINQLAVFHSTGCQI